MPAGTIDSSSGSASVDAGAAQERPPREVFLRDEQSRFGCAVRYRPTSFRFFIWNGALLTMPTTSDEKR